MWFNVITIIVSAAAIGIGIANIIYYNRIRGGTCGAVSEGEATTMLWINVVLIVLAAIPFLWGIVNLFFPSKCPSMMEDVDECGTHGYQTYPPVGYAPAHMVAQPGVVAPPHMVTQPAAGMPAAVGYQQTTTVQARK